MNEDLLIPGIGNGRRESSKIAKKCEDVKAHAKKLFFIYVY